MNRRHFLASLLLGGTALGSASAAGALTLQACRPGSTMPACTELLRHKSLAADLLISLRGKGLTDAQCHAILAKATCPFCGQLLIG